MDVKEEQLLGGAVGEHWYYRSKQLALDCLLRGVPYARVLDIGAGSAVFSKHLIENGAASAVCVDPAYTSDSTESWCGKPIRYVRDVEPCGADLVLLMDVLEHVDDDVGLIRESMKGAAPGAFAVISVPAFPSLFSAHDRFLDHKRRYRMHTLENVARTAGLNIISARYFFAMILPLVATLRLLQRDASPKSSLVPHPTPVNALMTFAHRLELPFFRFNRMAGLSVFCLARAA
jgi:2-polyprenyl-3-methyl-5-hydroxy-6-metoxy-1,4-benzoquinol methylase